MADVMAICYCKKKKRFSILIWIQSVWVFNNQNSNKETVKRIIRSLRIFCELNMYFQLPSERGSDAIESANGRVGNAALDLGNVGLGYLALRVFSIKNIISW